MLRPSNSPYATKLTSKTPQKSQLPNYLNINVTLKTQLARIILVSAVAALPTAPKIVAPNAQPEGKPAQNVVSSTTLGKFVEIKKTDTAEALIAHVSFDQERGLFTQRTNITEITMELNPHYSSTKGLTEIEVFPDSGASICLAEPQHLTILKTSKSCLNPCKKKVRTVGSSTLTYSRWLPITFTIGKHSTVQPLIRKC